MKDYLQKVSVALRPLTERMANNKIHVAGLEVSDGSNSQESWVRPSFISDPTPTSATGKNVKTKLFENFTKLVAGLSCFALNS